MDEKKESCQRCGAKITPKTKRAKFCSDKCRVYWNRENPKVSLKNFNKGNKDIKPITDPKPKKDYDINTMPDPKKDRIAYMKWIRENT